VNKALNRQTVIINTIASTMSQTPSDFFFPWGGQPGNLFTDLHLNNLRLFLHILMDASCCFNYTISLLKSATTQQ
jgi:hypothetical protein